jgi:hypothetical protein
MKTQMNSEEKDPIVHRPSAQHATVIRKLDSLYMNFYGAGVLKLSYITTKEAAYYEMKLMYVWPARKDLYGSEDSYLGILSYEHTGHSFLYLLSIDFTNIIK